MIWFSLDGLVCKMSANGKMPIIFWLLLVLWTNGLKSKDFLFMMILNRKRQIFKMANLFILEGIISESKLFCEKLIYWPDTIKPYQMTVTLPVDIFAQERLSVFALLSNYCPKNGVTVGGRNEERLCVWEVFTVPFQVVQSVTLHHYGLSYRVTSQ